MPPVPGVVFRRLAYATIGAAALGAVTYVELDATGGVDDWLLIPLAFVVALFGPGQLAFRTVGEWLGSVSYETRLALEEPVKACVVGLATLTSIPYTKIGVTVFVVLRSRYHLVSGIQKRVVRIRMESNPQPTSVTWTKRKGLLGKCWSERRPKHLDHAKHFASHTNCSKTQWKALGQDVRQHLTYNDYLQIREFGFVLAVPMVQDGRYRGCLVIQVPATPAKYGTSLRKPAATEFLNLTAALTCAVLK